jgi:hypothetical protein
VSDQRTLAVAPARLPEDVITNPPIHGAKVHGAMAAVMGEIGGVAKGRENKQQNYMFRGIADITKAAQPLLAKHGLHLVPHRVVKETKRLRETAKGGTMMHIVQRIEFRFYHQDGSWVSCETTGEAMDSGDKASNKCMSAALKYALIIAFCIPEEDPEADTENNSPELAPPKQQPPAKQQQGRQPPPAGQPAASGPKAGTLERAMRIDQILTGTPKDKDHLGLPKPAAFNWLKARFGKGQANLLSEQQQLDAEMLLLAKLEGDATYRKLLSEYAKAGRCLGDGEVAA